MRRDRQRPDPLDSSGILLAAGLVAGIGIVALVALGFSSAPMPTQPPPDEPTPDPVPRPSGLPDLGTRPTPPPDPRRPDRPYRP